MIPPFIKDFDKLINFIIVVAVLTAILSGTVGFVVGRLTASTTKFIEK